MAGHRAGHRVRQRAATDGRDWPGHDGGDMSEAPARVVFTTGFSRRYTGGVTEFEVAARTLRGVIREMDKKFPGLAETLEEETTVAIDGELYEIDFLRPVKPGAEVFFIPKIEGG